MLPKIRTPRSQKNSKLNSNSTRIVSPNIITLCPHITPQPKPGSPRVEIHVKVRYQEFERLIYQSSPTPYRAIGPMIESIRPFDPFCEHCYNRRLQLFMDVGLSAVSGKQKLDHLRNRVIEKVREIERGFSFDGKDHDHDHVEVVPLCHTFNTCRSRTCYNEQEYVSWIQDMSSEEARRNEARKGPIRADAKAVAALETVEEVVGDENCGVCLEELSCGSSDCCALRKLPCLHVFHEGCIFKWLECSYVCPLCRYELPKDHTRD